MEGTLPRLPGDRLAVLTNGVGTGLLALDRLQDLGGVPAKLSAETVARLDAGLTRGWSRGNPVDLMGDADGPRYAAGLEALLDDPENDAVLAVNVPTVLSDPQETAEATVRVFRGQPRGGPRKPVLALWLIPIPVMDCLVLTVRRTREGRSPFAGRLGEQVAAPGFTLLDDAVEEAGYQVGS